MLKLFLPVFLAQCLTDIQVLTLVEFAVEFSDSGESAARTVLSIFFIIGAVANEEESLFRVLGACTLV